MSSVSAAIAYPRKDVQHFLSRAHTEQTARTAPLIDALVSSAPLDGVLRVPNTVGDIEISTNVKARRITAYVSVSAPEDRGAKARCSWIDSILDLLGTFYGSVVQNITPWTPKAPKISAPP